MIEKCSIKEKLDENEKKSLVAGGTVFWFTSLVVWIFIIKQFMYFSIIISFLFTSASMTTQASPIPTTSNPSSNSKISRHNQSTFNVLPQFLSVHQLVDVPEGSTAKLECTLGNLGMHHTVSWMRSSDMSVLTVGGFVFSSDPRIGVVAPSRPGQVFGTWTLQIEKVGTRDAGEYQCQVNSDPKESLDVTLVVTGDGEDLIDVSGEKEIYSVFKNTHIYPLRKLDFSTSQEREEINIVTDIGISEMTKKAKKINKDYEEQVDKIKTKPTLIKNIETESFPKASNTGAKENTTNVTTADTLKEVVPEATVTDQRKQVAESTVIVNEVKDYLTIQEATHSYPTDHDETMKDNTEHTTSLLIPILSLSIVILVILVLGSVRGFYSRYVKTTQGQHRSRSTTRTLDSRRSSGSRSSEDSMYNNRRMRRMAREMEIEKERMIIYDEIMQKTRLSPLIEVIEPTPPLQRNSPIFMMTSLDMLGISDESEYEADISDITCNTKPYEDENYNDTDTTSQNVLSTEPSMKEDEKSPSKYEMLRSKIQSYLSDHNLLKESKTEEEKELKRSKIKLVDNINTFL